jgi:hypothetical protein
MDTSAAAAAAAAVPRAATSTPRTTAAVPPAAVVPWRRPARAVGVAPAAPPPAGPVVDEPAHRAVPRSPCSSRPATSNSSTRASPTASSPTTTAAAPSSTAGAALAPRTTIGHACAHNGPAKATSALRRMVVTNQAGSRGDPKDRPGFPPAATVPPVPGRLVGPLGRRGGARTREEAGQRRVGRPAPRGCARGRNAARRRGGRGARRVRRARAQRGGGKAAERGRSEPPRDVGPSDGGHAGGLVSPTVAERVARTGSHPARHPVSSAAPAPWATHYTTARRLLH